MAWVETGSVTTLKVDAAEVMRSIEEMAGRVAALVRGIPQLEVPAKGLDWSLRQTAAHLVAAASLNAELLAGNLEPHQAKDIAALNQESLAQVEAETPEELAEAIIGAAADLLAAASVHPAGQKVRWMNGVEQDIGTPLGGVLGEFLVHGFDIARSAGKPWDIRREHAAQVIAAVVPVMPFFVHQENAAGFKGSYDIRVRGGVRFLASFDNGVLTLSDPVGGADGSKGRTRPDYRISADPVALLLISYGRVSQWGQLVRGKMLAWGRKPWLAAKFGRLLVDP